MQVGECSDYKFHHNSVAPGSDSSDVSTEGSNQREVPVSASAPDEQQPSKIGIIIIIIISKYEQNILILLLTDITSTGDEGESGMSATVSAGRSLSRSSTDSEIHHSSESGEGFVRVKWRVRHQLLGISECIWVTIVPTG